ncbi:hypothetical protein GJ496_003364 [Pomphorhynchus laevis]|nr:hypothetical protein GJ496_003364 [Pomphorhynchus laevis]
MQEGSSQDVDGATDLKTPRNIRFLDEVLGIQCAFNTTTESHLDSSGTCGNSYNSGSLVMNDQSHDTLPDLRYYRNMDCEESYTCREIIKKHLQTKHPGQSDKSTSSGTITPKVATASGNASFPTASSDKLQISTVRLLIPSDDTVTYLLDVTWMIKKWKHLRVVEQAVCDDEGLLSD